MELPGSRLRPMLALLVTCLLWGTADVAAKAVLETVPPITLTALRFTIAAVVLWPLARRAGQPARVPVRKALPLALIGISGMFLLQNFGLSRIAATNAVLLQGAAPAVTLLVAVVLIKERIGIQRALAIAVSAAGVLVMSGTGGLGFGGIGLGDGLVLASMVSFGVFVVLSKETFARYGNLPVAAAVTAWGAATLIPAAAVEMAVTRPAMPDLHVIGLIVYLGIGCSAVTYALWGYALRNVEIGCVAAFDAIIPLAGCAAAVLLLGERLTTNHMLGGGAALIGLLLIACESERTAAVDEADNVHSPVPVFATDIRFAGDSQLLVP